MGKSGRLAALAAACCILLSGCSISAQERYERGQFYFGAGDYETAEMIFRELGDYSDSEKYSLYAAAHQAMRLGKWELAEANLKLIAPFASSAWCLQYIDAARKAEQGALDKALAGFAALGSFLDSADRAEQLKEEIPERTLERAEGLMEHGHFEEAEGLLNEVTASARRDELLAECEEKAREAAYHQAKSLYQAGRWQEAMAALDALKDYQDSAALLLACRSGLYRQAEEGYQQITLATAEKVLADFYDLEDYLDSRARSEAIEARWGTNLRLWKNATSHPYVVFGEYPLGESGTPAPVRWQVLTANEDTVTLLACDVLDAMDAASAKAFPLMLNTAEAKAEPVVSLPTERQIAEMYLTEAERCCTATAYALAQGVRHDQAGNAWYYLAEEPMSGYQAAVWYNGRTNRVRADYAGTGVRPIVTFSLNAYAFTEGDGSAENPYR